MTWPIEDLEPEAASQQEVLDARSCSKVECVPPQHFPKAVVYLNLDLDLI